MSVDIYIGFAMMAATVARSSLNCLQQSAFASSDIWLRLMLEDRFQIPFQGVRPVCQSRDRNTDSPVNFKAHCWRNRCKAFAQTWCQARVRFRVSYVFDSSTQRMDSQRHIQITRGHCFRVDFRF